MRNSNKIRFLFHIGTKFDNTGRYDKCKDRKFQKIMFNYVLYQNNPSKKENYIGLHGKKSQCFKDLANE